MKKLKQNKLLWIGTGVSLCCLFGGVALLNGVSAQIAEVNSVELHIDTHSYTIEELPNGVEGKTYPVFEVTATDNLGGVVDNVEVLVYNPSGELLPIVDGRFSTETTGTYKIAYTAALGGYNAQQTLEIAVLEAESYAAPFIQLSDTSEIETYTGEQVWLPTSKYGKGIGELSLSVAVDYLGVYQQKTPIVSSFGDQQYFIPEAEGEYVVTYMLSDLVGTEIKAEIPVSVEDCLKPIMTEPAEIKLAHVGETVAIPVSEAKLYYKGELIYVPVKVYVGEEEVTDTMSYQPEEVGEYTVKYVAQNVFDGQYSTAYEYSMRVVEPDAESYVDNYLYLDGLTTFYREADEDGLEGVVYLLKADGTKESAEMQFKKPIHEQYLSVELGVETEYSNFDELYVTFTDSENAEERIEIKLLENKKAQVEMYVNGRYVKTLDKSFTVKGESFDTAKVQFVFDPATNEIGDGNMGILTKVEYTEDGKPFEGFSSGKAYLSVKANGIEGECHIKLYRIASMVISNIATDRGAPLYLARPDFADSFRADINDTVKVSSLEAFDLFDYNVSMTTKIVSPTDKTIFDGTLTEDYYFTVTEYGVYNIEYTAYDSARNAKKKKAVIDVVDRIPPMIVAPELPTRVTVGTEFSFENAVVSDNYSENCLTWIYVINENYGTPQVLENKYTFKKEGTYVIKYGAADETGNITVVEYTIICVKGDK